MYLCNGYVFAAVLPHHYDDVIMTMLASQITSLTVVYSIVYSGVNQRKHQSSASLAFVREIHRGPVNFPHKWPVTRKMFPFDDVIMLRVIVEPSGARKLHFRLQSIHIYWVCIELHWTGLISCRSEVALACLYYWDSCNIVYPSETHHNLKQH